MTARHRHLLSAADEVRLSRRVELADRRAREEMINANLGLVRTIALGYRSLDVPFEDLVQEGTVGLMRAVDRFDHRRGTRFSTFAVFWIRRALADAVGGERTIRIPAQARRRIAAVERAETELPRGASRSRCEAIADRAGLTVQQVQRLREAARVTTSLDAEIGDAGTSLLDVVADPGAADPWRQFDERERRRQLWAMLKLLPRRQREVLVRRYGVHGGAPESHAAIAAALGVGEERSRQLEREALHRLRGLDGGRRSVA